MGSLLTKQPSEKWPVAIDFAGRLPDGVTLQSGTLIAANLSASLATTLAAGSAVGATTLSLAADPKVGAILSIDNWTAQKEVAQVKAVSGAGPYTVTLTAPLEQAHAIGADVKYYAGTTTVLDGTSVTIAGDRATGKLKGGQHGVAYLVTFLLVLSDASELEEDVTVQVSNA